MDDRSKVRLRFKNGIADLFSNGSWAFWALGLLALIPLVAVFFSVVGKSWSPTNDLSIIDLRSRDIFSSDSPLTGLFSRRGWSHPGPAMFYILAPFSWFKTSDGSMLRIGWVLIDCVILGAASLLAWRVGKVIFLVTIFTELLSFLALPSGVHRVPWNPWMPVPMLILLLVLAMRVNLGRTRDIIGLFVLGSIMIQIHASTAPIVVAIIGWALFVTTLDAIRSRSMPERSVSTALWSVGVSGLIWLPPLIGVFSGAPGNLRILFDYFLDSPDGVIGLPVAARIMAAQFRWVPPALGGRYPSFFSGFAEVARIWWLLIPVALLVIGSIVARLSKRRDDERLVAMAGILFLISIFAISRADVPYSYTFEWRGVVAPFVVLVALVPPARFLLKLLGKNGARGYIAIAILAALVAAYAEVPNATTPNALENIENKSLDSFRSALLSGQPVAGETILLKSTLFDVGKAFLFWGMVNQIDLAGGEVRVPSLPQAYGSRRIGTAANVNEVWTLRMGALSINAGLQEPGARMVWRARRGEAKRDRDFVALYESLVEKLEMQNQGNLVPLLWKETPDPYLMQLPGIDPYEVSMLALLTNLDNHDEVCRCAVIAVPGGKGRK